MSNEVECPIEVHAYARGLPELISNKLISIEKTFVLYAGPAALQIIPETYAQWVGRHQPRLATLCRYAQSLAVVLPLDDDREAFIRETTDVILTGVVPEQHAYAA